MKSKSLRHRRLHHLCLLMLPALWQIGQPLRAANLIWDITSGDGATITGGTGIWTNGLGNWNTGAGDTTWNNVTPDAATFGGTAGTVTLGGAVTVGNMTFNTADYVIAGGGNSLTLSNSTIAANANSTISADLGGTSLIKTGGGTLTFSGTNTYTGATTVSAGVLNIQNASALGTVAAGTSVTSGAALQIQGGITTLAEALTLNGTGISADGALRNISGNNIYAGLLTLGSATRINSDSGTLTLSNTGTVLGATFGLTVGGAGNTTINSIIGTTSGTVTKDGAGALTLTGANTYTGLTTISAGVLNIQNASALGTVAVGTSITSDAALQIQGGITTLAEALTLNGTGISADGALRNISGNNIYAGLLTLGSATRINSDSGTLTLSNTGTVLGATFGLTVGGAGNTTINSILGTTSGTLTKDGAGTLTLTRANTYTGLTTVSAGVLNIQNASALGTVAAGTRVTSGAALQIQGGITTLAEALTLNGTGISADGALRNISGNNIYAGLLTLGSATRISSDTGTLTLSNAGTITGAGLALTVGGAGNTTITSLIGTTTGTLTKDGAGTLTLSNTGNSFSGGTTLGASAGTVIANTTNGTNVTALGTGAVAIGAGSTVNLQSVNTVTTTTSINNTFTGTGLLKLTFTDTTSTNTQLAGLNGFNGTIELANGATNGDKLSGVINAPGATLQIDNGSQLYCGFFGSQTFANVLVVGNGNSEGYGAIRFDSGSTLTVTGSVSLLGDTTIGTGGGTLAGNIVSGAAGTQTLTLGTTNANSNATLSGNIGGGTGTILINKTQTGTVILSGTNTYTGLTTVSAGVLNIRNASALGTVAAGTSVTSGATLQIQGGITTMAEALTLNGTGISTTGALRNISGDNNYAGLITLGSATRINSDAGTLTLSNAATITGATFGLTVGGAGNTTINSILGTTSGTLTKDGAGALTLTGVNTYTGLTTVSAGVLNIQNASALGTVAAGTSVTSGAALQVQGGITTLAEALTLNGTGISTTGALRNISGDNNYAGLVTLGSATRINSDAGTLTLSNAGTITGATFGLTVGGAGNTTINSILGTTSGTVTKDGAGALTLTGGNTYTGLTTISAGVLNIQNASALGTVAAGTSVTSGAALQVQGGITTMAEALTLNGTGISTTGALRNISGDNNYAGLVTLGSATRINSDAGTLTLSNAGTITGATFGLTVGGAGNTTINSILGTTSGALTKDGAGTLTLTGANTYTGATLIQGGTLLLSGAGSLADTTDVSLTASSSFSIAGINAASETVGSLSGVSGSTVELGGKDLTVSNNANFTFSGAASGIGSSLTKAGTGIMTLSGNNTYSGGTNLTGGTLLMGGSNVLPNTAALNLSSGTKLDTGGFSDTTGALSVTGPAVMDLGTSAGSQLTFSNVGTWSGLLSVWNYTGAPWTLGTDKLIFTSGSNTINLANVQFFSDNGVTQIGTGGGGLIGNELVPVPEPGAVLAGGLLLALVGWRERRRRVA